MKKIFICFVFSFAFMNMLPSQTNSKREFRGVWISVIRQQQYQQMSPETMKAYFSEMLDTFQKLHINAVIFQVRPASDAFYPSALEPWSRYLSGEQGRAPTSFFDPLLFLIEACHQRSMEFHAWLNPYRVTADQGDVLHYSHIYHRHPEWFVEYGNRIYFDPGLPKCRNFICKVVKDIVSRYDIDAIHMDDYFYPYPIAGEVFPDDNSFMRYGRLQGFLPSQKGDWRRDNVNLLIRAIKHAIISEKPWVRFGISPFGIYRNRKSTPDGSGSETHGLQNYDDLYADVKWWMEKGWIDYNIPQIYWNIGNKAANYEVLVKWWNENNAGAHLYIGQDVAKTMQAWTEERQLSLKMCLEKSLPNVKGHCFWSGYELMKNTGGICDSLRNKYQRHPSLIPAYTHLHDRRPKDVKQLKSEWTENGYLLHWKRNGDISDPETAQYFVIYRFANKETVDLNDPSHIVEITRDTQYQLPYQDGKEKYKYIVTSVDRFHNESGKGKTRQVKL